MQFFLFSKIFFNQNDKIYSITYYFFRFDNRFLIIFKKTVQTLKKNLNKKKLNNYRKKLSFNQFFVFNNRFIRCRSIRRFSITFKIQHENEK